LPSRDITSGSEGGSAMARNQFPWTTVSVAGVRIGGPNGRLSGFLWVAANNDYCFAYHPTFAIDPQQVPLDPINLPLGWKVYRSAALTGALQVFGRCMPGPVAEKVCWPYLAARIIGELPSEDVLPNNDLARLVWSCFHGTLPNGLQGLWFDPSAVAQMNQWVYHQEKPRQQKSEIDFWADQKRKIPAVSKLPSQVVLAAASTFAQTGEVERHRLMDMGCVMPLPGRGVRLRADTSGRPQMIRVSSKVTDVRDLRLRAAYLSLAAGCGLRAASCQLITYDGRDLLGTEIIRASHVYTWASADEYRGPTAKQDIQGSSWLTETMKKGTYLGRSPWQVYARLSRQFADDDRYEFDHKEAYARLCFAVLTGTLPIDTTPVMLSLGRSWESYEGFFIKAPLAMKLMTWMSIKPSLLPYKTALAMKRRLLLHASRYGRMFALDAKQREHVLTRVVIGLMDWEKHFASANLNDYEANGIRPAIMVPAAESGQATQIKAGMRIPRL